MSQSPAHDLAIAAQEPSSSGSTALIVEREGELFHLCPATDCDQLFIDRHKLSNHNCHSTTMKVLEGFIKKRRSRINRDYLARKKTLEAECYYSADIDNSGSPTIRTESNESMTDEV
jgi:uncharacterized C2H2 Zn-finger protein